MFYPPSGYLLLVCYLLVIYLCTISFRIIHTNQRLMFYGYLFRTVLNVITEFTLNTTRRIYSKHYLMLSKLSGYQYLMFQVNKILPHEYILSKSLLKKQVSLYLLLNLNQRNCKCVSRKCKCKKMHLNLKLWKILHPALQKRVLNQQNQQNDFSYRCLQIKLYQT